ncbi:hypothetical protein ABID14_000214 [Peptoniphilus olsenii]|uniref:Phage protein n=1 Tax=Peptoniphilus olsenii TaxID=411570 RepID=A0ABV2J9Y8_9FIRM
MVDKKTSTDKTQAAKYTKDAILRADKLVWNRDVLSILLEDDKEYTLNEVDKLVNDFNTREVK